MIGDGVGYRSFASSCNNLQPDRASWASSETALLRVHGAAVYAADMSSPLSGGRSGPRQISNAVVAQPVSILNTRCASAMLVQWGSSWIMSCA